MTPSSSGPKPLRLQFGARFVMLLSATGTVLLILFGLRLSESLSDKVHQARIQVAHDFQYLQQQAHTLSRMLAQSSPVQRGTHFRHIGLLKDHLAPSARELNVDLIVVRENTEGLYSGLEHIVVPGVVESLRIVTERGSERIIRFAFDTAARLDRRKVTVVHKANILKLSDGLFLEVARKVARDFPLIEYEEAIVDATAMKLVLDPHGLDVLVMENLFGDIISDLTSGLVGGLGMSPSANIGEKYAIFEAVHGSANDIAGKGIANPTALILSSALMLRHLGETQAADAIESAVRAVMKEGAALTGDLGGNAGTSDYVDAIVAKM